VFSLLGKQIEIVAYPIQRVTWAGDYTRADVLEALPCWLTYAESEKRQAFIATGRGDELVWWYTAPLRGEVVGHWYDMGTGRLAFRGLAAFPLQLVNKLDALRSYEDRVMLASGPWVFECPYSRRQDEINATGEATKGAA